MPDITADFRQHVDALDPLSDSAADDGSARYNHQLSSRVKHARPISENIMQEAYAVAAHIHSQRQYLLSIRKPYIDSSHHPRLSTTAYASSSSPTTSTASIVQQDIGTNANVRSWLPSLLHIVDKQYTTRLTDRVNVMTDQEKDHIDLESKLFIAKCRDRVKALESLLAREQKKYKYTTAEREALLRKILTTNTLEQPNHTTIMQLHNEIVLMHYSGVIWLLNKWLVEVSNIQRDMQERRMQRELDRLSLSSSMPSADTWSATTDRNTTNLARSPQMLSDTPGRFVLNVKATVSSPLNDQTITNRRGRHHDNNGTDSEGEENNDDDTGVGQLSAQERSQLEAENQALLAHFETTLDEVKTAETSLIAIAQMQSELSQHLYAQQSTLETLYDQAVMHTENIKEGNVHVARATDATRSHRSLIMFILIVLSGVLLFLDWYN